VLFPLKSGNERHGYIFATDFDAENAPKIKETLELATFILGSEIGNHLLLKRLQFLSSRDMLTETLNRNEMNNYVTALSDGRTAPGKPVGVLFADLNGLKRINDSFGHSAGDELIKAATRVLRNVFHDEEIFRVGGDEFTVIVVDATLEEMEEKAKAIKEFAKHENKVNLAVGYHVEDDCRNVRTALRKADEKMYEDKRQYYMDNPN
jgi:diguanylate cyclase (GGDEF)-like protein